MSVTVSIKVRKELVELADKMVRYRLARSRSHAFNLIMEKGLEKAFEEVKLWERAHRRAKELEEKGYKNRHGGLTKILEEDRGER